MFTEHTNKKHWHSFLTFLSTKHDWIINQVRELWIEAPGCLSQLSGHTPFSVSLNYRFSKDYWGNFPGSRPFHWASRYTGFFTRHRRSHTRCWRLRKTSQSFEYFLRFSKQKLVRNEGYSPGLPCYPPSPSTTNGLATTWPSFFVSSNYCRGVIHTWGMGDVETSMNSQGFKVKFVSCWKNKAEEIGGRGLIKIGSLIPYCHACFPLSSQSFGLKENTPAEQKGVDVSNRWPQNAQFFTFSVHGKIAPTVQRLFWSLYNPSTPDRLIKAGLGCRTQAETKGPPSCDHCKTPRKMRLTVTKITKLPQVLLIRAESEFIHNTRHHASASDINAHSKTSQQTSIFNGIIEIADTQYEHASTIMQDGPPREGCYWVIAKHGDILYRHHFTHEWSCEEVGMGEYRMGDYEAERGSTTALHVYIKCSWVQILQCRRNLLPSLSAVKIMSIHSN